MKATKLPDAFDPIRVRSGLESSLHVRTRESSQGSGTLVRHNSVVEPYRFTTEIRTSDGDPAAPSPDKQAHRIPTFSGVTYLSGILTVIIRGR